MLDRKREILHRPQECFARAFFSFFFFQVLATTGPKKGLKAWPTLQEKEEKRKP